MGFHRGPKIVTDGLVFAWNGVGRSWDGVTSNTTHRNLVGGKTGTKTGSEKLPRLKGRFLYSCCSFRAINLSLLNLAKND